MNYFDGLRLAVGSVLVTKLSAPPFEPFVVMDIYRDEPRKRCAVRLHAQNSGEIRTHSVEDLERAPELARWDPDRLAWFSLGSGAQVLPKPDGAA